jgi:tetratricopeptide (TPR) repeat protein
MTAAFLSRFTPSVMAPRDLESLLVHRDDMLSRVFGLVADSVNARAAHHVLFIGPRGIGKTHLVSVLFHRLITDPGIRDRLVVAWLREEEWGVTSFLDLLLRILRALPTTVVGDGDKAIDALYGLPADTAESRAAALLLDIVKPRSLILLTENLDELFAGLGDEGQKRFRALLQQHPQISVIATAQSLFVGVSRQISPFYGFFHTHHLSELSLDEATSLLARIAGLEGNEQLAAFLRTPLGRARVRAVHHLAGGNHRIYVILSQFLTRESLDEFVGPLLKTLDDLTPYYQARMAWLSPQQRKIVEALCDLRHAGTVGELAQRCFITHQTASAQLKVLRDKGYVSARQFGRESYYDLREPLMRLCIEIKKERARPVRLFLDFLRLWYTPAELSQRLESLHSGARLEREYVSLALQRPPEGPDPRFESCRADFKRAIADGRFEDGLLVAEELVAIRGSVEDWLDEAHALIHLRRWREAEEACVGVLKGSPDKLQALVFRGQALLQLNRTEDAVFSLERATKLAPSDAWVWDELASAYCRLGRHEDELTAAIRVCELNPQEVQAWTNRGTAADEAGRPAEALAAFERLSEFAPERGEGWIGQAGILLRQGRTTEAHRAMSHVNAEAIKNPGVMARYARVLGDLGNARKGIEILSRLPGDVRDSRVYAEKSRLLLGLGRWPEAVAAAEEATSVEPRDAAAWHLLGQLMLRLGRYGEALTTLTNARDLSDRCGSLHFDLAAAFAAASQWEEVEKRLGDGFKQARGAESFKFEAVCLMNAVFARSEAARWDASMRQILLLFEAQSATAELGEAIVQAIAAPGRTDSGWERLAAWLEVWQRVGRDRPTLEVPLRLLGVALRYRQQPDEKALLDLPVEERRVLGTLLGLDPPHDTAATGSLESRTT